MDDYFDKTPAAGEQPAADSAEQTRAMPPVASEGAQPSGRRRRTERNRSSYDDLTPVEPDAQEPARPAEAPAETIQMPVAAPAPASRQTDSSGAAPRFQTRYTPPVPGSIVPSQGVPRPTALNTQERRPVFTAGGEVRRPVQAEGYTPIKPLGTGRTNQLPEDGTRKFSRPDNARAYSDMPQPAEATGARRTIPLVDDDEYEEPQSGSKVLPIVIIALLVVAALVLGLLMIPADMEGPLGDAKRAVTGLFGGETEQETSARAVGLTANIGSGTAPYQITFQVMTMGTESVRIVDAEGAEMPATKKDSFETTSSSGAPITVQLLEVKLETAYEGVVWLEIHDGDSWQRTEYSQTLTMGADQVLRISSTPASLLTTGFGTSPSAGPALTAGSATEPTVSPKMEETLPPVPTDDAAASVQEDEPALPVNEPLPTDVVEASPTEVPTPTPTLAVTPTPTVRLTPTPEAPPTETPSPSPTEVPTPSPTATPAPTAAPTPKLEASAAESASPDIIATQKIYKGTRRVDTYLREKPINMPAADDYLTLPLGVTTFRGNAFRTNAAEGTVTAPTAMSIAWQVEGGSLEIKSGMRYGFGVYSQPAIVQWIVEVRQAMDLNEGYNAKRALKEVIISGLDGKIYFLDLEDGQPTRDAIELGYAMRGAPSVHPLNYPLLVVGQYSNKLPNKTSKTMGLYYYSLMDGEQLRLIDGLDGDADRQYYSVGAFDTSALIDRNTNTLIAVGTNGLLYTETLDLTFALNDGGIFDFADIREQAVLMSHTKNQDTSEAAVESSLAMYGSYAFYADMGGVLRCVDTTTMTTVWAVKTGDAVRAAVALDLDQDANTLWLYTANTLTNRSKNGDVTIRRYNAMTGEMDWELPVHCLRKSGQKDSIGNAVTSGAVASPIIGQNGLGDMVYFTLSGVSAQGNEALTGKNAAQASVLIAINKADGSVVWTLPMDAYSYSSPVAVYSEEGQGWVIQCCSNGTIYLLDGLTGEIVNTLQVVGIIEGSPAVYGNMMVFGTTGKDKSFIYGIRLE